MKAVFIGLAISVLSFSQNPNTAVFPGAVATDNDLLVASNNADTTLPISVNATTTTIPLASWTRFVTPLVLTIDGEIMRCLTHVNGLYTCQRGFNGTSAASHSLGTAVHGYVTAWPLNQANAEIKAIEGALGVNLANVPSLAWTTIDANYATLTLGCAAAGSGTLYVTRVWNAISTQTLGCGMSFLGNGKVQAAAGQTVTMTGTITAPPTQQIFDIDLGGAVNIAVPMPVYVAWWGGLGNGTHDDSTAIQGAINSVRLLHAGPGCAPSINAGGKVIFGSGTYAIGSLDMTGACGIELEGVASWSVSLYAYKQTGTSKPVLDMTGCSECFVNGITFNGQQLSGESPATVPSVGVLLAGYGSGDNCNFNRFDNTQFIGFFVSAGIYDYGCTDNLFINTSVQSWNNGTPAMWITGVNDGNISSPYKTITSGSQNTGEMNFSRCEFHDLARNPTTLVTIYPSSIQTIRIVQAYSLRFYGGVVSNSASSANGFIHFEQAGEIRDLIFDGQEYYGDQGVSLGPVFYSNSSTVRSMSVRAPFIANTTIPAVIGGAANAVYTGLQLSGIDADYAGVPVSMPDAGSSSTYTITDAYLDLVGKGFRPGGAIRDTVLINPGTITIRSGNARWDNVTPVATFSVASQPLISAAGTSIFLSDGAPGTCLSGGTGTIAVYQNSSLFCPVSSIVSGVVANTNCGSLAGTAGCLVINVSGVTHYVPYY